MKYVLAPLAGFTSAPFRKICAERGADLTYTEMVSAAGLAHGSSPTRHLMETLPGEGPVGCQIFGSKAEELAYAAAEATKLRSLEDAAKPRFAEINLNAGCPMPKVVREGAGAALLKDPENVHNLLRAMKRETDLPLTLKTRPGPNTDRVLLFELLDAAEKAGCAGLTVHGRFTSQQHGGEVRLDLLAELVSRSKIPVTGNGGVYNPATAREMEKTGVAAVMVGRAAMANPWIFGDLKSELPAEELEAPARRRALQDAAFAEHLAQLLEFRDRLAEKFPGDHVPRADGYACNAMHVHLFRYFNGRPGAAALRKKLAAIRTLAELEGCAKEMMAEEAQ